METKKEKIFVFRMTPNEERALHIMANAEGRNCSEMAREAIREAAARRGLPTMGELGHTQEQPA